MSDGPYRSLPMSRGWKRLAKFAENANFDRADTCAAATHALSATWRNEVPAAIVKGIRDVFLEREPGLFSDMRLARIDAVVSDNAGYGLGRFIRPERRTDGRGGFRRGDETDARQLHRPSNPADRGALLPRGLGALDAAGARAHRPSHRDR